MTELLSASTLTLFARGTFALLDLYPILQFIKSQIKLHSTSHTVDTFNDRRFRLVEELVDAFVSNWNEVTKSSGVTNQELEVFFVSYFEGEFEVLVEDGSETELVKELKSLWEMVVSRDEVEASRTVEELEKKAKGFLANGRKEFKVVNERQTEPGEEEDSSSSDEDDEDDEDEEKESTEDGMEVDQVPSGKSRPEKVVDEDGFELVQRKVKR